MLRRSPSGAVGRVQQCELLLDRLATRRSAPTRRSRATRFDAGAGRRARCCRPPAPRGRRAPDPAAAHGRCLAVADARAPAAPPALQRGHRALCAVFLGEADDARSGRRSTAMAMVSCGSPTSAATNTAATISTTIMKSANWAASIAARSSAAARGSRSDRGRGRGPPPHRDRGRPRGRRRGACRRRRGRARARAGPARPSQPWRRRRARAGRLRIDSPWRWAGNGRQPRAAPKGRARSPRATARVGHRRGGRRGCPFPIVRAGRRRNKRARGPGGMSSAARNAGAAVPAHRRRGRIAHRIAQPARRGRQPGPAPAAADPESGTDDQAQDHAFRHAVAARRGAAGPRHRRARDADLPDGVVRVSRQRPRRRAVQHGARGPRLLADLQPDLRGARGADRRARGRRRRDRGGERAGGAAPRDRDADGRRARTSSRRARSTAARTTCSTTRCRASASTTTFVDPRDLDAWRAAIRPETRLLFGETLGNPGLDVLDIPRVADLAHEHGLPLLVDSTFTTPSLIAAVRAGRRPRLPLGDQVPVRARRRHRRPRRRLGAVRLGRRPAARGQVPDADRALRGLPRHGVRRGVDDRGVPAARAARGHPRLRRVHGAVHRVPDPAGHRDAAAADGAPRREHAQDRRLPGRAPLVASVGYPELPGHPDHALAQRLLPRRLRRGVQLRPRRARARRAGGSSRR